MKNISHTSDGCISQVYIQESTDFTLCNTKIYSLCEFGN